VREVGEDPGIVRVADPAALLVSVSSGFGAYRICITVFPSGNCTRSLDVVMEYVANRLAHINTRFAKHVRNVSERSFLSYRYRRDVVLAGSVKVVELPRDFFGFKPPDNPYASVAVLLDERGGGTCYATNTVIKCFYGSLESDRVGELVENYGRYLKKLGFLTR